METLLNRHGFPLYIYDSEAISGRISRLKEVFDGFDILYSMKCNSNDAVCRHITAHGLGIPYAEEMQPLDLERLHRHVAGLMRTIPQSGPAPVRLYMESGRFLVGKAGVFVTRIVDVKHSRGRTFVIAAGLLNHFLRPAIAGLMDALPLERTYAGPCEPLWSGCNTVVPKAWGRPAPARTVTVCGNLCTAMDTVAHGIPLENAVVGNLLVFENAGAYAAALSPHGFSSQPGAKEILWA